MGKLVASEAFKEQYVVEISIQACRQTGCTLFNGRKTPPAAVDWPIHFFTKVLFMKISYINNTNI